MSLKIIGLLLSVLMMAFGVVGLVLSPQLELPDWIKKDSKPAVVQHKIKRLKPQKTKQITLNESFVGEQKLSIPQTETVNLSELDFHWNPDLTVLESPPLKSERTPNGSILKLEYTDSPVTGRVNQSRVSTEYHNGLKHGYEESYYQTKNIRIKRLYHRGKAHGPFVSYYNNGQIREERHYSHGYMVGERKAFYENGAEWFSEYYEEPPAGLRNRNLSKSKSQREPSSQAVIPLLKRGITYYRNGQLQSERNYVDGKLNGLVTRYLPDGTIFSEVEWQKGAWVDVMVDLPKFSNGAYAEVYNTVGMNFVHIPEGLFKMKRRGRKFSKDVEVSDFYLSKYEMTQAQYELLMGDNPSQFFECGEDCPVESGYVTFINELNRIEGCSSNYDDINWKTPEFLAGCYRLPSAEEWRYAARAGSSSTEYWEAYLGDEYNWNQNNAEGKTQSVGLKKPNTWGLYDIIGNVSEQVAVKLRTPILLGPTSGPLLRSLLPPIVYLGGDYKSPTTEFAKAASVVRRVFVKRDNPPLQLRSPKGVGYRVLMDSN